MKKILLLLVGIIVSVNAFAQIRVDKVEDDGSRIIISNDHNIYTGWTNAASVSVIYVLTPSGEELYQIHLCFNEGKMQFDIGRKLLLKFADDSVMEFSNITEIGPADYEYRVTDFGTSYYTYPDYLITEEEIQKIVNGNVIKIRVENNLEYFDRIIKKNKFSLAIRDSYQAIQSRKDVKNDVYEGF